MPFLPQAIRSVLGQSLQDLEFIIVDDKSTDESLAFIKSIRDRRINLIASNEQQGQSAALNTGIAKTLGEFIARMDHDDVCLRTRLAEQVEFLNAHPDVDIVGTWAKTLGRAPEQTWRYPTEDADIRSEFVFNSSLVHSSVMWRRAKFRRHDLAYDPAVTRAQDYELWTRAQHHVRFGNIRKVLLQYRIHKTSVGAKFGSEQKAAADRIRERELNRLGVDATDEEIARHHSIARWEFPSQLTGLIQLERWLERLSEANQVSRAYPRASFGQALERRWWAACRANIRLGSDVWRLYSQSRLRLFGAHRVDQQAIFWGKAALHELGKKL